MPASRLSERRRRSKAQRHLRPALLLEHLEDRTLLNGNPISSLVADPGDFDPRSIWYAFVRKAPS